MSLAVGIPVTNRWMSHALELLPLIMVMPLGPLILFYTKSVLDPAFRIGRTERLQFYPVVLDWGANLMGWIFIGGALLGFFRPEEGPAWGNVMDEYNAYVDIPRWLSVTFYLFLTKRLFGQLPPAAPDSEAGQQRRRWLRQFINAFLIFQTIWLLFMVPYIVPGWRGPLLDRLGWYPVYIPIAILIYWLGLKGYLHARNSPVAAVVRKVSAAFISAETVEKAVRLLTNAMQTDKLYLDPELTVEKVSRHVQLPPKTVSLVINQHLQKSFSAFVNGYRIEAVKQQLTNPANGHLTLTGIAFACGFNSQATFQRAFRQMTGVTPKEYAGQPEKTPLKSGFE
ncbi:MAG: helix-turn-helix transcriptional regulator [Ferruginibacter sp.]|nr:helix-turn-helix transcriptional regulator [Cytophagales bacterium]